MSPFMRYYIGVIMRGAAVIAPYAVNLTLLLAMIDGAIKISFDLIGGNKIKFLITMILKVGFFIFLIQSWVGTNSSYQLMPMLSSGFETMGYTAGGSEEMIKEYSKASPDSNIEVQSNQIVTNALNFFNIFWEHAQQQNLLTIFIGLVCVVAAVVILFLTALEMFMVRIEFWTMALLTIPLLSFGVISQLKFLSDKAVGLMFNLATKIFVVAFISTMSVNILTGLVDNAKDMATSDDFMGNISYFLQVLLYAFILFYMTKKIPELVSGLLSGNPSLNGGSMRTCLKTKKSDKMKEKYHRRETKCIIIRAIFRENNLK
ncbi:MAG: type IV secretion system protein [Selenomonadaceae bacterium]|nr:type IV secretion system protein [Selenomonadaceae bacterium]